MLYVDGASNVYGDDLEDRNLAWPFLLSQKLDIPINNVAQRGKSNQHMLFDLINNCITNKPKFVVLAWQPVIRKMVVRRENNCVIDMSVNSIIEDYDKDRDFKKYQELTYKYWSNFLYDAWNFLQIIICAQNFLKTHNIPYLMFNDTDQTDILHLLTISSADVKIKNRILDAFDCLDDSEIKKIEYSISSLYHNIDHDRYYDFSWYTHKLVNFYTHPNAEQHRIIANFVENLVAKHL